MMEAYGRMAGSLLRTLPRASPVGVALIGRSSLGCRSEAPAMASDMSLRPPPLALGAIYAQRRHISASQRGFSSLASSGLLDGSSSAGPQPSSGYSHEERLVISALCSVSAPGEDRDIVEQGLLHSVR